ncbi:Beta-D-glucosyl crocetin beta-1,6-glucosyltransferase [Sesamum alatum]|uniref:Glycosyltransferase n=1 Tax=Sesamum alatum TaxID=300844 RepID=A0AAE1YSG1_9LAMI|nr:Beta-D-glucosyl crocetin beta-1,6-glucosyltransferase [Sesamum alatum]
MAGSRPYHTILGASQETLRQKLPLLHLFHAGKPHIHRQQNPTKILHHHPPPPPPPPLLPRPPSSLPHHQRSPLHLHSALRSALRTAKPDFSNILTTLQPHLLIHDIILRWAGAIASKNNIPSVTFFTSGATMFSYFCHLGQRPGVEFPYPAIRLTEFELSMAVGTLESSKSEDKDPDEETGWNSGRTIIVNSSREIDGKYIDYLSELLNKEFIPVGSLVRDYGDDHDVDDAVLMEWLSQKDKFSCVFVSFGTEYFLKKEEIEEVAYGLELSNVNFIWIMRFPKGDGTTVEETLPAGFLERVGGRGRIVEKWASQAKILTHPSVGGFVSHCGWNSLTESIEFGVPIIAMPMHLDQPMNAKLVAELGVGVEVKRDNAGRLQREEMAKVIRDVVVGETGGELRRQVVERRERIRLSSREEMEGVAHKLAQLCGN